VGFRQKEGHLSKKSALSGHRIFKSSPREKQEEGSKDPEMFLLMPAAGSSLSRFRRSVNGFSGISGTRPWMTQPDSSDSEHQLVRYYERDRVDFGRFNLFEWDHLDTGRNPSGVLSV